MINDSTKLAFPDLQICQPKRLFAVAIKPRLAQSAPKEMVHLGAMGSANGRRMRVE
jgi:hypothetical protein